MDKEKFDILNTNLLQDLYLNFSDLKVNNDFLIFESRFSTFYEKPKPPIAYIDKEFNKCFIEIKFVHIEIIKKRMLENKTLQEVGNELLITRERVRQIEKKTIKLLNVYAKDFIINTKVELGKKPIIYIDELPIKNNELKLLYCNIVSHPQSSAQIIFDKDLEALVLNNSFTLNGITSTIEQFFQKTNKSLFNKEDLLNYLQSLFPKLTKIEPIIDLLLKKEKLRKIGADQYFFYFLYKPKKPMVEFIFSQFPNGIFLYKQTDYIKAELDKYFPDIFGEADRKRGIATLVGYSENIYLWDWGKYIHIKYINPILEEYDFTNILNYIDQNIGETQVDLKFCFDKFKQELLAIGIVNKYALHTCLKLKFTDDYSYQDSPWIAKAGTERRTLNTTLLNLLTENKIYTLDDLALSMKTKKLRIQQLVDHSYEIISVDVSKYINRKYIEFSDDLLNQLVKFANDKVLEFNYFYIDLIVNAFSEQLKAYSQYNTNTLVLELLRKYTQNTNFNISNTRIVNKNYLITKNSFNFHVIINNLLSNKDTLSMNQISNYFVKRGLSVNLISSYFLNSKLKIIVRLDREVYTSIEKIGINDNNIEDLNLLMENIIDSELNIQDLIDVVRLPKISVQWNRFLFADLMYNEKFLFNPSRENPRYIHKK